MNATRYKNKPLPESNLSSGNGRVGSCLETPENSEMNAQLVKENRRLKQERDLLRALIDNYPDSIYAKDKSARKILANKATVRNVGCKS